jgi:uncharacterized protein YbbC (DUF1343 family)
MINGEGWLQNSIQCNLEVIKIQHWDHQTFYALPVPPSPNLPNSLSVALYPSLALFEGTTVSVGRGTAYPFQQVGHPDYPIKDHSFTPIPNEGSKYPPHEGKACFGEAWIGEKPTYQLTLAPLLKMYKQVGSENFFNSYFKRLAGTDLLQKQIERGLSEAEIRKTWKEDLALFKEKRKKYLLYK